MISVVVPVYNVEAYVGTCVKSIQDQTYRDLDIILVDDGATDGSGAICDRLAADDARIRVLHKPNGGLSDARNAGLSCAKGEYVCFIDSDDWIEPRTLEEAVTASDGVDVVVWGYYKDTVDKDGNLLERTQHGSDAICRRDGGYVHLMQKNVLEQSGYAWNKLYRTGMIRREGLLFEKGLSLVEDIVFNFPLFMRCDAIRYIPYPGTHYMQRPRTTLGSAYYPNRMELKLRAADLTRQLLLSFGAPEETAQEHYMQNTATMLRSAIRLAASGTERYADKRRHMVQLLDSGQCRMITAAAKPRDLKNKLVLAAARMKWADLLLIVGKK